MGIDRILQLKLIADVSNINKSLGKTESRLKQFGRAAAGWGKAFAAGLALKGVEVVTQKVFDGIAAFQEGRDAAEALGSTWKALGMSSDALADQLAQLEQTGLDLAFGDPELIRTFNRFLTMTEDTAKAQKMLGLAMDIARGEGISLEAAMSRVIAIYRGSARYASLYGTEGEKGMKAIRIARRKEKAQARRWAKNHPFEVFVNNIDKQFERLGGVLIGIGEEFIKNYDESIGPKVTEFFGEVDKLAQSLEGIGVEFDIDFDIPESDGIVQTFTAPFELAVESIKEVMGGVNDFLAGDYLGGLTRIGLGMLGSIGSLLAAPFIWGWELVRDGFAIFNIDIDSLVREGIQNLIDGAKDLGGNVVDGFKGIWKDIVAIDWWKLGTKIVAAIGGGIDHWKKWLLTKLSNLATAMVNRIKGALNKIIGAWNSLGIPAGSFDLIGKPGDDIYVGHSWGAWTVPQIPKLAEGGIVTKPTLALIGEAGREAVVPLDRGMGMGGNNYTIHVNATTANPAEVGRSIVDAIKKYEAREGKLWRSV